MIHRSLSATPTLSVGFGIDAVASGRPLIPAHKPMGFCDGIGRVRIGTSRLAISPGEIAIGKYNAGTGKILFHSCIWTWRGVWNN